MRKRSRRRPVPVRPIPIWFGFSKAALRDASIEARSALCALLDHKATPHDVATLSRIALYCHSMVGRMMSDETIDQGGMADTIEAVNAGCAAMQAVIDRFYRIGKVGAAGQDREPLMRLIDAYEAIFTTATRRESIAAMSSTNGV